MIVMVKPVSKIPDVQLLFSQIVSDEALRKQVLGGSSPTDSKGRYLHWEEVRHRKPPKGLTREQYWLSLKLGRRLQSLSPVLLDKQHRPFVFFNPEMVLRQLHEVDKRGPGDLIFDNVSVTRRLGRFRMLIRPHVEEAIQSSLLEGASTTRAQAKKLLDSGRDPETRAERMVWNNLQANEFVQQVKDDKLTPAHIRELHRIVTDNILDDPSFAGRWRLSDDIVIVDPSGSEQVIHVPPPALSLPERIERICAFANRDLASQPFIHPVIHAILLHFMIGYDHPFVDGNGRTARGLFFWGMARAGYWLTEYLAISRIIRQAPAQYTRAYQYAESDDNDTTYFVLHQLKVILRAYTDLEMYMQKKLGELDDTVEQLEDSQLLSHLNDRQVAVLSHALKNPGARYRIRKHQYDYQVTYQTARTDLLKLTGFGLLLQTRVGRSFEFIAPQNLLERVHNARTN